MLGFTLTAILATGFVTIYIILLECIVVTIVMTQVIKTLDSQTFNRSQCQISCSIQLLVHSTINTCITLISYRVIQTTKVERTVFIVNRNSRRNTVYPLEQRAETAIFIIVNTTICRSIDTGADPLGNLGIQVDTAVVTFVVLFL